MRGPSHPDEDNSPLLIHLQSLLRNALALAAFILALLPSFLKMYETSHWFREGDPSKYDSANEWFSNPNLPYAGSFKNSRRGGLMRVYFFIIPYMLSAAVLMVVSMISTKPTKATTKPHVKLVGRSFLYHSIPFPRVLVRIGSPLRISVGELLGVCAFLVVNLGTLGVCVRRSLADGSGTLDYLADEGDAGKETINAFSWQACEIWAKTLGLLAILNFGWYLLMPIGRRSIFLEALNMPWERAVKYHRWIGFYTVAIMFFHGFMYFAVWAYGNEHPSYDPEGVMLRHNLLPWGCNRDGECDDRQHRMLRINMYGIVALVLVIIMACFALPWVRRHKFEWFYYMHHLFMPLIIFAVLHYGGTTLYLIPGIAIYSVDKIMGFLAYCSSNHAKVRLVSNDVLEFSINLGDGVTYKTGQYIFLNVPDVSFMEWHPFSITSAPGYEPDKVTFHLKGAGNWTRQVLECAAASDNGLLRVRLDGFYGHEPHLEHHRDGAILVGGGIGVTPMISMAMGLLKQGSTPVTLLWVVRTIDEFQIFSDKFLRTIQGSGNRLKVKVWITLSQPEPLLQGHDEEQHAVQPVDKAGMKILEQNEQVSQVQKILSLYKERKAHSKKGTETENNSCFKPLGMSNTPALNAFIMFLAIWMGLNSYALATWLASEKGYAPREKSLIIRLSLLMVFVLIVICFAILVRLIVKHVKSFKDNNTGEKSMESTSTSKPSSTGDTGKDSSIDSDDENDTLKSMIEGRIGCRPNLEYEFREVAMKKDADIGVIACGPLPMIQEINKICNEQKSCFSWGVCGGAGDKVAFYAFTEDDWEW